MNLSTENPHHRKFVFDSKTTFSLCCIEIEMGNRQGQFRYREFSGNVQVQRNSTREAEREEIIRTRKEQLRRETDEKRLEIVMRLRRRKFEIEQGYKEKLFGLPDQVWEEILSYIKNPKDLHSMWEVHPKFRQLSPQYSLSIVTEYLLSQLLSIERLPYLWHYSMLRMCMLLIFRGVSSELRSTVDRLFEDHFLNNLHNPGWQPHWGFYFAINEQQSLNTVLSNFYDGSINCRARHVFHHSVTVFMGHRCRSDSTHRSDIHHFTERVTSFLHLVGDQIWSFRMDACDCEMALLLHEWTPLLPNLKCLELKINDCNFFRYCGSYKAASRILKNRSFPHFKNLERINLILSSENQPKLLPLILISTLQRNTHVKVLVLNHFSGRPDFLIKNLEKFLHKMNLIGLGGTYSWALSAMNILKSCTSNPPCWKLKSLSHCFKAEDKLELATIFNFLNNIPTLEHVHLLEVTFKLTDTLHPLNRLTNLRNFEFDFHISSISFRDVENLNMFVSLDFLVECVKLKTLIWTCKNHFSFSSWNTNNYSKFSGPFLTFLRDNDQNRLMAFQCGWKDLEVSNVWQVFPALEKVNVTVMKYDNKIYKLSPNTSVYHRPKFEYK